jgi:hypothetical protein
MAGDTVLRDLFDRLESAWHEGKFDLVGRATSFSLYGPAESEKADPWSR